VIATQQLTSSSRCLQSHYLTTAVVKSLICRPLPSSRSTCHSTLGTLFKRLEFTMGDMNDCLSFIISVFPIQQILSRCNNRIVELQLQRKLYCQRTVHFVRQTLSTTKESCSRNNAKIYYNCSFTVQWQAATGVVRVTADAQNFAHALLRKLQLDAALIYGHAKNAKSVADRGTAILNSPQKSLCCIHRWSVHQIFRRPQGKESKRSRSGTRLGQDTGPSLRIHRQV
jgi:hypothetical protein